MKTAVLFGLGIVTLLGCSADHTIADGPRGSEERLSAQVDDFCSEQCLRLDLCRPPSDDCACAESGECTCAEPYDCEGECRELFRSSFVGRGAACADTGLAFMECIEEASCDEFEGPDGACESYEDAAEACRGEGGGDPPTGKVGVSCSVGFQTGAAGSAGGAAVPEPNPQTTCDQGWDECSDGHGYRVICLAATATTSACTCFVDGLPQQSFAPATSCPTVGEVNHNCGWRLLDF